MSPRRFHVLGAFVAAAVAVATTGVTTAVTSAVAKAPWHVGVVAAITAALSGGAAILWWQWPRRQIRQAIRDGIEGLRQGDHSLRLRAPIQDAEIDEVVGHFNEISNLLREHSHEIRQRELIVDAIVDHTGTAVVIVNAVDRVVFASRKARRQFFGGRALVGETFSGLLETSPASLRDAVRRDGDALIALARARDPDESVEAGDESTALAEEHVFVQSRRFELNGQPHRLVLLRPMGLPLRRQELEVWKKVVRVISHELNSAMTPVSSLLHSARLLHERGANDESSRARLADVLESVANGVTRLRRYVDGYANFARLPAPMRQTVELSHFVETLAMLATFECDGDLPSAQVTFDTAQVQQALLNLLRNAAESGGPLDQIELAVELRADVLTFEVRDRGPGMDSATLRQAVLPFFSTKSGGTGLGLAVAREVAQAHGGHLELLPRSGGGLVVRLALGLRAEQVRAPARGAVDG